jgi:DNA invertase Pin-like site-specific DNA recombinase
VAAQVAALRKHGASKVFREVVSGAKTKRVQLRCVIDQLDACDVLMVTRLDRLARLTRDLLNTAGGDQRQGSGLAIARRRMGRQDETPRRQMLTALGGLAELERDLTRARTSKGRERAKARGVKLGRKRKLTDHQKREAIRRRDIDGEPVGEMIRSHNVHDSRISRLRV